jgi:hypothetical protein
MSQTPTGLRLEGLIFAVVATVRGLAAVETDSEPLAPTRELVYGAAFIGRAAAPPFSHRGTTRRDVSDAIESRAVARDCDR